MFCEQRLKIVRHSLIVPGVILLQFSVRRRFRDQGLMERICASEVWHLHGPGTLYSLDARVSVRSECGGFSTKPDKGLACPRRTSQVILTLKKIWYFNSCNYLHWKCYRFGLFTPGVTIKSREGAWRTRRVGGLGQVSMQW